MTQKNHLEEDLEAAGINYEEDEEIAGKKWKMMRQNLTHLSDDNCERISLLKTSKQTSNLKINNINIFCKTWII